jgi:8-oxo-dGTP pyrophosphatase MutT (NUDIX family)
LKTKQATSAGGGIFRRKQGQIEIALISHTDGKVWALPKGTVEADEDLEATAVREVEEETGLKGRIIDKIGAIDYWFYWKADDTRYHKFVHFYLLEFETGSLEKHDHEVEVVIWSPIEKALSMMTYKSEIEILEKAQEILLSREPK